MPCCLQLMLALHQRNLVVARAPAIQVVYAIRQLHNPDLFNARPVGDIMDEGSYAARVIGALTR